MNFYVDSNGSQGYYDLIDSNFGDLKLWIKLCDFPRSIIAELITKIEAKAKSEGKDYDIIHDSLDSRPSGIIVGDKGVLSVTYNNGECFMLSDIIDTEDYESLMSQAYACFREAKCIHDDLEQVYIKNTDFTRLNFLTEQTINMLFGNSKLNKAGIRRDRFFGAATVNGAKDYIDNLTQDIKKRYLIKGRAGTGKSTIMRKIAEYALNHGFDVEVYHCAFDPNSLDMLVFRELGICMFDSTSPHEYFPSTDRDEVIDVYEQAVNKGTDEKYATEISAISCAYKEKMEQARILIDKANNCLNNSEEKILPLLKEEKIIKVQDRIIKELF